MIKDDSLDRNAYIFSEVEYNEETYIIPFDGHGIPIEYEKLKKIVKNMTEALKNIAEKDYNKYYNESLEKLYQGLYHDTPEQLLRRQQEKQKSKEEYIKRFDSDISKPILSEEQIEKILKNWDLYSHNFLNLENIKYPILVKFYKNNSLIKTIKCNKNFMSSLANMKKNYDFDEYSYSYISEDYIDQIYEYIILFENPLLTTSLALKKHIVYNTIEAIRKRINSDDGYIIRRDKIIKILDQNNIYYFQKDGKTFTNARLALEKISDYISGVNKKDF